MEKIIFLPIIGVMILGFALQLYDIAESSSEKTVKYADDMNKAMDCAFTGRLISECSPELMSTNFKEEANQTLTILQNMSISS
jgi:hypothetical protein